MLLRKKKKKTVTEDSLEEKKKTNTTYLILHRIHTFLTMECHTYSEFSPKGRSEIAPYFLKENSLFTGTAE